jgi:hypothetical protein
MINRVNFSLLSLSAASLVLGLSACGGGGGSVAPTTLNGNVIDGYITGATVCLDENNNLLCDDEFSAVTKAAVPGETGFKGKDGWYTFTVTRAIVPGTQVVADIPVGATDSDLGRIENPFKMLAPVDKPEVISPLTTLVSITMKNADSTDSSQAEKEVKVSLGLAENTSILGKDFISDNDANLINTAIVTASVMKEATKAINTNVDSDKAAGRETLDSKQVATASLQQALAVVKEKQASGSLATAVQAVETARASGSLTETSITQINVNAGTNVATSITGNWQDIQSQTKSGSGSVVNLAKLNGQIMIVSAENARLDKDNDPSNNEAFDNDGDPDTKSYLRWSGFSDRVEGFRAEWFYLPVDVAEGEVYPGDGGFNGYLLPEKDEIDRRTNPSLEKKWYPMVWTDDNLLFTGGTRWFAESETQFKIVDNCFIEVFTGQETRRFCFVEKDFKGKKLKELTPEICLDDNNGVISGCDKETVMTPTGSQQFKVYDVTLTVSENKAKGVYKHWRGGGYSSSPTKEDATLEKFIFDIAYLDSTLNGIHSRGSGDCRQVHFVADVESLLDGEGKKINTSQFKERVWAAIKASGVKVSKGDLLWVDATKEENGCAWPGNQAVLDLIKANKFERTPFTIEEIGGKRVMKLISPKIYRAKKDNSDSHLIFVEHELNSDGSKYFTVAGGEFSPSNFKEEIFFTGNFDRTTVISKDLFEFLLVKRNEQPYPFDEIKSFFK